VFLWGEPKVGVVNQAIGELQWGELVVVMGETRRAGNSYLRVLSPRLGIGWISRYVVDRRTIGVP
jgi:hypothetical protein